MTTSVPEGAAKFMDQVPVDCHVCRSSHPRGGCPRAAGPIDTVESAEAAARRFAGELQRLYDGLIAAGLRTDPHAPVDRAAVDAALALAHTAAAERYAFPLMVMGGGLPGPVEAETPTSMARRLANELQRLRDGLVAVGVNVHADQFAVEGGIVNAALAVVKAAFAPAEPAGPQDDRVERIAKNLDTIADSCRQSLVSTPPEYAAEAARHRHRAEAFERAAEVARSHAGAAPAVTGPEWVTTPADQHARELAVIAAARALTGFKIAGSFDAGVERAILLRKAVEQLDAGDVCDHTEPGCHENSAPHAPAETWWNGEPAEAMRVRVIVADAPEFPAYWARAYVGTIRKAVRVTYNGDTFYLDNEDGSGWHKVTDGGGSPRLPHGNLAIERDLP